MTGRWFLWRIVRGGGGKATPEEKFVFFLLFFGDRSLLLSFLSIFFPFNI